MVISPVENDKKVETILVIIFLMLYIQCQNMEKVHAYLERRKVSIKMKPIIN